MKKRESVRVDVACWLVERRKGALDGRHGREQEPRVISELRFR